MVMIHLGHSGCSKAEAGKKQRQVDRTKTLRTLYVDVWIQSTLEILVWHVAC